MLWVTVVNYFLADLFLFYAIKFLLAFDAFVGLVAWWWSCYSSNTCSVCGFDVSDGLVAGYACDPELSCGFGDCCFSHELNIF